VDSPGSGWGPVAGSHEYGDEPLGSGATEAVSLDTEESIWTEEGQSDRWLEEIT
jgi:hypothetical protein